MMINFTQVSPSRPQVRIDGIEEGDPSSWAGGAVSEFRKSVPNHIYRQAAMYETPLYYPHLYDGTGNQCKALKVNALSQHSLRTLTDRLLSERVSMRGN